MRKLTVAKHDKPDTIRLFCPKDTPANIHRALVTLAALLSK